MSNLRQIGLALREYAEDHNGQFPQRLEELVPDYITSLSELSYRDPLSRYSYDWHYHPGHGTASSADTIVAASPSQHLAPTRQSARLVLRPSGSVEMISDLAFSARMKQQQSIATDSASSARS